MADSLPTSLNFTLIAPEQVLASHPAAMVTLPGSEGMLGILPGHAPLITALKAGVVTVEGHDEKAGTANGIEQIFVTGGFAEVTADGLTILADEALPITELDGAALLAAKSRLEADLQQPLDEADKASLTQQLQVVEAKLSATHAASHKAA